MSDQHLSELMARVETMAADIGTRIDRTNGKLDANTAGIGMALAKLDAVEETLGRNMLAMQQLSQTVDGLLKTATDISDAILVISADLTLLRQSVAQQVTHEVDKKLDAHLSLVELAEVARVAGDER